LSRSIATSEMTRKLEPEHLGQRDASCRTEGRIERMRTRMGLLFEGEDDEKMAVMYDKGREVD
jgi:hypothetical protein